MQDLFVRNMIVNKGGLGKLATFWKLISNGKNLFDYFYVFLETEPDFLFFLLLFEARLFFKFPFEPFFLAYPKP